MYGLADLLKETWYQILRADGRGLHSLLETLANLSNRTLHEEGRAETWEEVLRLRGQRESYDHLRDIIEADARQRTELDERRRIRSR